MHKLNLERGFTQPIVVKVTFVGNELVFCYPRHYKNLGQRRGANGG